MFTGLLFLLVMLSACGVEEQLTVSNKTEDGTEYRGTVSIGERIYEGSNNVYYDGLVGDSIVIGYSGGAKQLFVPGEISEWVKLPLFSGALKIKINSIDKETGNIDISIAKRGD